MGNDQYLLNNFILNKKNKYMDKRENHIIRIYSYKIYILIISFILSFYIYSSPSK